MNSEVFEKIFLSVFDNHAPLKKKFLTANSKPYMTKQHRKVIMKRSDVEKSIINQKA